MKKLGKDMLKKNKKVFEHGVNDSDTPTKISRRNPVKGASPKYIVEWECPFYIKWMSMLRRCYSGYFKNTVFGRTYYSLVCEEWLTFSNFKSWMETQEWEGKELDKDILGDGKLYSPKTCIFVDPDLNKFLLDSGKTRGKLLIGVDFHKSFQKYRSRCSYKGRSTYLGSFDTELEAHLAWVEFKIKALREILNETDYLSKEVKELIFERKSFYFKNIHKTWTNEQTAKAVAKQERNKGI